MPRKYSRLRRRSSKKSKKKSKKSTPRSANSKIRGGGGVFSSAQTQPIQATRRRNHPGQTSARGSFDRPETWSFHQTKRARALKGQDLKTRLPEDVIGEIREIHPLLTPKLTNATIKRAVWDYLAGGARKQRVVTKYGDISNWDVSNVTNMGGMFLNAESFNQPLDNWNVTKVMYIESMFFRATTFNQPLNNWKVSKVKNMDSMFMFARSFNQPLNNWNVSNVTNMTSMFAGATSFNQPLNNWDVSNVRYERGMFFGATSFKQHPSLS